MAAVAEEAGVSVAAVSMALSDSPQISDGTKRRVRATCRRLGYKPRQRRQGSAGGRAHYGLMVVGRTLRDGAITPLVNELAALATSRGTRLEVGAIQGGPAGDACAGRLADFCRKLDGVILTGILGAEARRAIADIATPHLVLGNLLSDRSDSCAPQGLTSVTSDGVAMGGLAAAWLIQKGHRRIAFVCMTMPSGLYASKWADGYRLAHLRAALSLDPRLVRVSSDEPGGVGEAVRALAALDDPPTACVIPDSHIVHSVLKAAGEAGLRFHEGSVVLTGHEEMLSQWGLSAYPAVTENSPAMAEAAFRMLELAREGRAPGGASLIVPFLSHNMG